MSTFDQIRQTVSDAYAAAVKRVTKSGGCRSQLQQSRAPSQGYGAEELAEIPASVATSSFGCGNPLAFAEVKPGQTVVDLGSGAGLDLLLASKAVGPTGMVIGVDMTDAMIETARSNIARAGAANVEVRKGVIESLPVEDGSVDWVISNCVINLSPEKDRVFAEIARVLRPGGRMLVSDLVADDLPAWARASRELLSACIAGAVSEAEYLQGLEKAGLTDVEVRERVVYDEEYIRAFLESEELPSSSCCGPMKAGMVKQIAKGLAGKVQSLRIAARKPE